jgi:uncharacterized damage-inducible protein DinB
MMSQQGEDMNLDQARTLLDYHYWARDRMFEALQPLTAGQFTRNMGSSFASVRDTLVHIYGADLVWFERWQGRSPKALADPAGFDDVSAVREAWTDLERRCRALVDELGEPGISRWYEYTLLNGQPSSSVFWQMLQHVVNHGSYHRGQLTMMLRQLGVTAPKSMDLISYYRERQAAGAAR